MLSEEQPFFLTPFYLTRVSALAGKTVLALRVSSAEDYLVAAEATRSAMRTAAVALLEQLFAAVAEARSQSVRNALIRMRRAIFNHQSTKVVRERSILANTEFAYLQPQIEVWLKLFAEQEQARETFSARYAGEVMAARHALQNLVGSDLLKTLQITAPGLVGRLAEYTGKELSRVRPKEDRHMEMVAFRFVARMALKPSPLGRLAGVGFGKWSTRASLAGDSAPEGAAPVASFASVSRFVLLRIQEELANTAGTSPAKMVLNDCYFEDAEGMHFFVRPPQSSFADFTRERFVTIPGASPLYPFLQALKALKAFTIDDLAQILFAKGARSLAPEQLTSFLAGLKAQGVLARADRLADYTPFYLHELICRLESAGACEHPVVLHLRRISEIERSFPASSLPERQKQLEELSALASTYTSGMAPSSQRSGEPFTLIHEDTTLLPDPCCSQQAPSEAFPDLALFQRILPLFSASTDDQLQLAATFEAFCGGESAVGLMDFYRRYRRAGEQVLQSLAHHRAWPLHLQERYNGIQALRERAGAYLRELFEESCRCGCETVRLDRAIVEEWAEQAATLIAPWPSLAHHCQSLPGSSRLVVNRSGFGLGKQFSRYWNSGDPGFAEDLRAHIAKQVRALMPNTDVLDISASFGLNINIHPPLVEAAIRYPGTVEAAGTEGISLADLIIKRSERWGTVYACHARHQRRVAIIPYGFLFPPTAPPLYAFLCRFFPSLGAKLSLWDQCDLAKGDLVQRLPRLELGGLVIERRSWRIPSKSVPDLTQTVGSFACYVDAMRWQQGCGIPVQCFVRAAAALERNARTGRDGLQEWIRLIRTTKGRKPLFVDFRNPLSLESLGALLRDAGETLLVEECLPEVLDDQAHTREFLVELSEASGVLE